MAKKQNFASIAMPNAATITETTKEVEASKLAKEQETPAQIEDNAQPADIEYQHNQQQAQPEPPAQEASAGVPTPPAATTDHRPIEEAIDNDINMYAGITKPVSFALPKDIKRALDTFVDDYNDARPSNKTTQAKVVAQALRNFLAIYQ